MKKISSVNCIICMILVLAFSSFSTGCVRNRFSEGELQYILDESIRYIDGLDITHDPVLIERKDGKYTLKAENGEVVTLLETKQDDTVLLPLLTEENSQLTERILKDAENILELVKRCIQNKYYSDLHNEPSGVNPDLLFLSISEDGIKLFSEFGMIEYIKIAIRIQRTNESAKNAIQVQKQYFAPNGIRITIKKQGDQYTEEFYFGSAYDYTLVD